MNTLIQQSLDTPWKAVSELLRLLAAPFVLLTLKIQGVTVGYQSKFYGFPKVMRHRGSKIIIGDNFENRNSLFSNPLGINHPTILATWSKNAQIIIGDDVGISGGSIVASSRIEIGDGTIIGANCTIIDTNFHPVKSNNRRYVKKNVKSAPVVIGKNVFIGMNCIILKGAAITDNSVIPAGTVVRATSK